MKLRPQVQLRFRDEAQYEQMKKNAAAAKLSLNEWLLRKLEEAVQGPLDRAFRIAGQLKGKK